MFSGLLKQIFRTKHIAAKHDSGLKKCLSALDLTLLGVGAIIGTGIFVLTGIAAANQAGAGFGNFMGMAMNATGGGPQPQMQMPAGPQGISPEATTGAFFGSSAREMPNAPQVIASVEPPRQTARREMKGPSGVDDILKTFEEVRRQEVMGGMDGGMAGVPMMSPPSMNTMVPPAMNQPAVAAVMEIESLASGDIGSTAESTRTGGGRRRRKAAISGNTIAVNV